MTKITFVVTSFLGASSLSQADILTECSQRYSQCGGQNWPWKSCCIDESYECQHISKYFSQCLPKASPVDTPVAPVGAWGQCHSQDLDAPLPCIAGWFCFDHNDRYSQCVPEESEAGELTIDPIDDTSNVNATTKEDSGSRLRLRRERFLREKRTTGQNESTSHNDVQDGGNHHIDESGDVDVADEYFQCGGEDWIGPTKCIVGFKCQENHQFYWQCVPDTNVDDAVAPRYGQCGGEEWTGPRACQDGSSCIWVNDYYSQCLRNDNSEGR